MSDVFLSYAHEDRERAKHLAQVLENQGLSVWWDRKIIAGQTFDQVIEHQLANAACVVVLWSEHSVVSEWCRNEAAFAAERGVLVPAMIDSVALPLEFRRKQTADLSGWQGDPDHGGFQALVDGITVLTTGDMPPTRATPPLAPAPPRRWWRYAGLAVIGICVAVGGVWYAMANRANAPTTTTAPGSGYRKDILNQLARAQYAAVEMLGKDKPQAIRLIDANMGKIDGALQSFPDDPNFHALKGYAAKDVYQSSKNILDRETRLHYLAIARAAFEQALRIDANNASAHNGMGNVLFFEGRFDEAIQAHDRALQLTGNQYPAAEQDKQLVQRVRSGAIPFDF